MQEKFIVLKFGSSVLRNIADVPTACHEVYRWYREGYRVMAVVSALGNSTDELMAMAKTLSNDPDAFATAELLATGERRSAALMGIALDRIGMRARVLDPSAVSVRTSSGALDSDLISIDNNKVFELFLQCDVLVIPGFFGYDANERLNLLGRGGSDLSAVFFADALSASHCRLIKDVDGVYESDPSEALGEVVIPRRFDTLDHDDALRVAGSLIQPKAVHFAAQHRLDVDIAAVGRDHHTRVHAGESAIGTSLSQPTTRVVLLGLGTVGGGVFRHLSAMPSQFNVVGVLVRHITQPRAMTVAPSLLFTDPSLVRDVDADVVVDTLSDNSLSADLIADALARGIDVVTANKRAVIESQSRFDAASRSSGATLRYSAAVGGGAPMLEAVDRLRMSEPIASIEGVLNGTCNFILHQLDLGNGWDSAVRRAQCLGFAESDPSEDISGRDIERKLRILARRAFAKDTHIDEWDVLDPDRVSTLRGTYAPGTSIRLIATARIAGERVRGSIKLQAIDAHHPFASLRNEWNGLLITGESSRTTWVAGRGAGSWPTSESVVADLWDARRDASQSYSRVKTTRRLRARPSGVSFFS